MSPGGTRTTGDVLPEGFEARWSSTPLGAFSWLALLVEGLDRTGNLALLGEGVSTARRFAWWNFAGLLTMLEGRSDEDLARLRTLFMVNHCASCWRRLTRGVCPCKGC